MRTGIKKRFLGRIITLMLGLAILVTSVVTPSASAVAAGSTGYRYGDTVILANNASEVAYWDQYCGKYLYAQLTDNAKEVYEAIYWLCMEYLINDKGAEHNKTYGDITEIVSLKNKNVSPNDVEKAYAAIRTSCPVFFFILSPNLIASSYFGDNDTLLTLSIRKQYVDSGSKIKARNAIRSGLEKLYAEANVYASLTEKELYIYDNIQQQYPYNAGGPNDANGMPMHQYLDGLFLNGTGVCLTYAQCFAALANRIGLESMILSNTNHAWNLVKYADGWTTVDPTFGQPGGSKLIIINNGGTEYIMDGTGIFNNPREKYGYYTIHARPDIYYDDNTIRMCMDMAGIPIQEPFTYEYATAEDGFNCVLANGYHFFQRPDNYKVGAIMDIIPAKNTYAPMFDGVYETPVTRYNVQVKQLTNPVYKSVSASTGNDNEKPNGDANAVGNDNNKPTDDNKKPDNKPDDKPSDKTPSTENKPVYRLFNRKSGDHLLTTDAYEVQVITSKPGSAWNYEGEAFVSGTKEDGTPVYRVFNPKSGEHLYTKDAYEVKVLTTQRNWNDEGIAYYVSMVGEKPVMRLFNPKGGPGSHLYTADVTEFQTLLRKGWKDEGIAWFQ